MSRDIDFLLRRTLGSLQNFIQEPGVLSVAWSALHGDMSPEGVWGGGTRGRGAAGARTQEQVQTWQVQEKQEGLHGRSRGSREKSGHEVSEEVGVGISVDVGLASSL